MKSITNVIVFSVLFMALGIFPGSGYGQVVITDGPTLEMLETTTGDLDIIASLAFSPGGDGVGSMYVEGNFTLGAGSILRIDMAANRSQDYLQFGGGFAYDDTSKIKVETVDGTTPSSVFLMQGGFTSGMDVDELKNWLKTIGMLTINDQAPEWDYWDIIAVPVWMNGDSSTPGVALFATQHTAPEPATWVMLLAGIAGIFLLRRKKS